MTPEQKIERIEKACRLGESTHTWEDFRAGLLAGNYQMFDNEHGVCITEIIQAPRRKYLQCVITAGELPGVMALHDEVERHALANGCEFLSTSARSGWQTVLPNFGWQKRGFLFTKELSHA